MLKKLLSLILLIVSGVAVQAQELNCKVTILHEKILNTDPQVFKDMTKAVTDFMNTRKWTSDEFQTAEKIDCNILFNLTGKISGDDNGYQGTLSIQASRPVYNSSYNSTTVNYVDKDIVFHFTQYGALQFDDRNISGTDALASNLTAVLAYYSYIIIGLDYDSFSPNGGTDYLKKAQNIVNNAPEAGNSIPGWKAVDGTRNRYWIIDQLLSPRFQDMRSYWYTLHREGLDNMYNKPDTAKMKILNGLPKLSEVNKENPNSILLQFFFNAKADEIIKILTQLPKPDRAQYIPILMAMDVPDAAKYNSLK